MQSIIDSLAPNIKLVLCGSYISIMKELVAESNPLFGRKKILAAKYSGTVDSAKQRSPHLHRNQFDCVLRTDSGYDFYEAKFYKKKMSFKECKNEEAQIRNVAELDCNKINFVCSSGFSFESKDYELLNAKDLYRL